MSNVNYQIQCPIFQYPNTNIQCPILNTQLPIIKHLDILDIVVLEIGDWLIGSIGNCLFYLHPLHPHSFKPHTLKGEDDRGSRAVSGIDAAGGCTDSILIGAGCDGLA